MMGSKYFELFEEVSDYLTGESEQAYEDLRRKLSQAYRAREINESSYASLSFYLQRKAG